VVMRPIWLAAYSVNHSAPSGPTVIPDGELDLVGMGYKVPTEAAVMRPMLPLPTVNHTAPSGPTVIALGPPVLGLVTG